MSLPALNNRAQFLVRELHPGMGSAVAERTVLRKVSDGEGGTRFETWGEVADRVSTGNALLHPETFEAEKAALQHHISKASILMSGRHLQHGDETQPTRPLEVFSNCSTSATCFTLFMLLLNGSGVGRSYDDDLVLVNWNYSPNLRLVLDTTHPDFDWAQDESVREAKRKYRGENVTWFVVPDSREGWAQAVELYEVMTYQKVYVAHTLVLDFSQVRPKGAPIMGMQGRPSSGPKPLMGALAKIASIKGAGMKPWESALFADHYLAECVLVGGARRAARMATKTWRDKDIIDFVRSKRPQEFDGLSMEEVIEYRKTNSPFAYLWSSNNSVTVDAEFWAGVKEFQASDGKRVSKEARHAWKVLTAVCEAAYGDGTGEPGFINVDKLNQNDEGLEGLEDGNYVGSSRYTVQPETRLLLSRLAGVVKAKNHRMIVNPCSEIPLLSLSGYCVLSDVVPFHADSLAEAEDAFRVATRSLIRTNLMDNLYSRETKRTNRIGVGMTGVHEFAWKFFRVGFRDLINPDMFGYLFHFASGYVDLNDDDGWMDLRDMHPRTRAAAFWLTLSRFSRAVQQEAKSYSAELGVNVPHTSLTMKPAGTTSKLFGLTEGAHLPPLAHYMRWVQFRSDDPLVATYKDLGYPHRDLTSYSGTTIIGFPTQPAIGELGMGEELVTASQATPAEHYEWLRLLERYWLAGTDELGRPLHNRGEDVGGQVSYTIQLDPSRTTYHEFLNLMITHQSEIKCCSVLPVADTSSYEYLPEEALTKSEYEKWMRAISASSETTEEVDFAHIDCAGGACPVDFKPRDS